MQTLAGWTLVIALISFAVKYLSYWKREKDIVCEIEIAMLIFWWKEPCSMYRPLQK